MSTAILPGKFDDGDFDAWLREFDACSTANGWKVTEASDAKILKLPAFLRGRAASNFYAIPEGERRTFADAVKAMQRALCPPAKRENFFAEFELRALRPDEDPWSGSNLTLFIFRFHIYIVCFHMTSRHKLILYAAMLVE